MNVSLSIFVPHPLILECLGVCIFVLIWFEGHTWWCSRGYLISASCSGIPPIGVGTLRCWGLNPRFLNIQHTLSPLHSLQLPGVLLHFNSPSLPCVVIVITFSQETHISDCGASTLGYHVDSMSVQLWCLCFATGLVQLRHSNYCNLFRGAGAQVVFTKVLKRGCTFCCHNACTSV